MIENDLAAGRKHSVSRFFLPNSSQTPEMDKKFTDFSLRFMVILHISVVRMIFFCYNEFELKYITEE